MSRPSPVLAAARALVRRLLAHRQGASTIEYGLILAFIVLMMFGALNEMAAITKGLWSEVSTRVTTAR